MATPRLSHLARRIAEARKLVEARGDPVAFNAEGMRLALGELIQADAAGAERDAVVLDSLTRTWAVARAEARRRADAWGEATAAQIGEKAFTTAIARIQEVDGEPAWTSPAVSEP